MIPNCPSNGTIPISETQNVHDSSWFILIHSFKSLFPMVKSPVSIVKSPVSMVHSPPKIGQPTPGDPTPFPRHHQPPPGRCGWDPRGHRARGCRSSAGRSLPGVPGTRSRWCPWKNPMMFFCWVSDSWVMFFECLVIVSWMIVEGLVVWMIIERLLSDCLVIVWYFSV